MKVRCQCSMGLDIVLKILLNYTFIVISTKNAYLKVKKNTFNVNYIVTIFELIY